MLGVGLFCKYRTVSTSRCVSGYPRASGLFLLFVLLFFEGGAHLIVAVYK